MDALKLASSQARRAVAARLLASFQLLQRAVHADQDDIRGGEQS
jgi:hypothetical protein